jgi:nicotinamidase/pyrazinamidase
MKRALIIVDVQKDFCEGGSLAVAGGNKVADDILAYWLQNGHRYDVTVLTADHHNAPPDDNGGHFALPPATPDYVNTWPVHCVAGTEGNEFHEAVEYIHKAGAPVFRKGQGKPDYSGFQGISGVYITLNAYLTERDIDMVDVVGIAGDYCVKATAIDAVLNDYDVNVIPELVASVGGPDATHKAIQEVAMHYISRVAQQFND